MENLIKKELLREILDDDIYEIMPSRNIIGSPKNLEYISKTSGRPFDYINIYELENKGKRWANNKGFRIIEIDIDLFWVIPKKYNISYSFDYGIISSKHNTFFKACQWILEN